MSLPRVLSYPPVHDYVDRLDGHAARLVHREEPWPRLPHLYDPDWVHEHVDQWDLVHLHFTREQHPVEVVDAVLRAHAAAGRPVVWTAHDLRNPHLRAPGAEVAHLQVLADHADAVVTLTPGAADEVLDRFGRHARVIPHGPLVPAEEAVRRRADARARRRDGPARVLLLAKSLRANLDWRSALEAARSWDPDVTMLEVHLHPDAPARDEVEALAVDSPAVDLQLAPRLSTSRLWSRVAEAEVLLLPYRWGTHSGLLELATDLGTPVVAGDVGHLRDQGPVALVPVHADRVDPALLTQAVRTVLRVAPTPIAIEDRTRLLTVLRQAHAELYAELLGRAVGR